MTTTPSLVALILLGLLPRDEIPSERVDLVEVNHYFDENGNPVFDQVIYYEWSGQKSRFHVRTWRPLETIAQLPTYESTTGEHVATWQDRHDGNRLRQVRANAVQETWTQYDPEMQNRRFVPRKARRDLSRLAEGLR